MSETLTEQGRAWALAHASDSIVARIALYGAGEWPEHYVTTAIQSCNAMAAH